MQLTLPLLVGSKLLYQEKLLVLPGSRPWLQHPLGQDTNHSQSVPWFLFLCSINIQISQRFAGWPSAFPLENQAISGMLVAEGEEPFPFPTVEGNELKHDLDQLPQLCNRWAKAKCSHLTSSLNIACLAPSKSLPTWQSVLWPKWNQLDNNSPQDGNLVHSPIIWEITPALQLWGSGEKRFLSNKGPVLHTIPWWGLTNQGREWYLSFQSNSYAWKHIWKNTF